MEPLGFKIGFMPPAEPLRAGVCQIKGIPDRPASFPTGAAPKKPLKGGRPHQGRFLSRAQEAARNVSGAGLAFGERSAWLGPGIALRGQVVWKAVGSVPGFKVYKKTLARMPRWKFDAELRALLFILNQNATLDNRYSFRCCREACSIILKRFQGRDIPLLEKLLGESRSYLLSHETAGSTNAAYFSLVSLFMSLGPGFLRRRDVGPKTRRLFTREAETVRNGITGGIPAAKLRVSLHAYKHLAQSGCVEPAELLEGLACVNALLYRHDGTVAMNAHDIYEAVLKNQECLDYASRNHPGVLEGQTRSLMKSWPDPSSPGRPHTLLVPLQTLKAACTLIRTGKLGRETLESLIPRVLILMKTDFQRCPPKSNVRDHSRWIRGECANLCQSLAGQISDQASLGRLAVGVREGFTHEDLRTPTIGVYRALMDHARWEIPTLRQEVAALRALADTLNPRRIFWLTQLIDEVEVKIRGLPKK